MRPLFAGFFLLPAALLCAAERVWTGAAGSAFSDPANWSAALPPADDLTTDVARFGDSPAASQPVLSASRSVAGLVFSTPAAGWILAASDPAHVLSLGASGVVATAQTSGATTLSASLTLAATQTWAVGGGSALRATGSVLAGSSATATLAGQLVIGGAAAGDLVLDPAPGRAVRLYSTLVSAGAIQVNQRLFLGSAAGSTASTNVLYNSASAGVRVSTTGLLEVRSGEWRTNDLGSNNTAAFTGSLNVAGGLLAAGGARYLGQFNGSAATTVNLSGGELRVTGGGNTLANSGHLGLGAHGANSPSGAINFNVTGGVLEVARGAGNFPSGSGIASAALSLGGVAGTTVLFNQSGGAVRVGVAPGSDVFSGATNANAYVNLSIGSALAANHAAYTLSGGSLTVAGAIQSVATPGGVSNFNLLGGTLSAGAVDVSSLGDSPSATASANQTAASADVGVLVNRGATLAPGGDGVAGRTLVTGAYRGLSGSALAIDIGGVTPASAFQNGSHDLLSVTGDVLLGGDLRVRVLSGYTPAANATYAILSSNGPISGAFANAPSGSRIVSTNGLHTFVVTQTAGSVTLGGWQPVVAPAIASATSPAAIAEGDVVLLGVSANSLAPVTYEWSRDGVPIPGATSGTLTLVNFQPADAGLYTVRVSNAAGSVTRDFSVRVTTPPSASTVVVDAGSTRSFSAAPGAASYRWILDGETVSTASSFLYSPVRREVGTHWLRVVETYADATTVTRQWCVRVRIPMPSSALAYYVSPSGSDTAAGTLAAPFATLEKARDAIRALSPAQRAGGVTVFLRGGVHRRTATFALAAQDSGTEAAPIVYAAYPGETPVLTSSRVLASSQWAPLAVSEQGRVAPGVDVSRIWEVDVTGNTRANAFPDLFNEWIIFNALRSSQNGGLLELFYKGDRMRISRYPNADLTDDTRTAALAMNGVAAGAASDGSAYLNGAGTYTLGDSTTTTVGGAFHYASADAARVARWQSAINNGGLWLGGYWRVPWQLNHAKVKLIDPAKQVIGFVTSSSNSTAALVPNGIGDKYTRPVGSKKEPWWVINLLEELDQPGEWAIDFNRKKLYFLMDRAGAPADGEVELADVGAALFSLNGVSDVRIQGLTFRRHLGVNIQVINTAVGGVSNRVLVVGCSFSQSGNMAVDINGGNGHGVLSSDFEKLASGGVMLRGASTASASAPSDHFAVNNRFRSFSEVVRVYQAAVDIGYGGPLGSWGVPTYGMRAAHNDIRTSPHAAILWNGINNVIEYNEVSDFTRISNDLGAIYRFGPNLDSGTIIRYNHLYSSPLGEGVYNDYDHVRTPIYGNVMNLKTPSTAQRGYGIWTTTNTAAGGVVAGLPPMALRAYNNIAVNCRDSFFFHSTSGGTIQNNLSYRALDTASPINWRQISVNGATNTASVATVAASVLQSGPNLHYANDPGFVDYAGDDLRLRPDAQAYRDMPGFAPIPLEMSGLYHDETRTSGVRVWTPFILTSAATSVAANTASFAGALVYPQFDANATVRVYWGTVDGGVDPAAWQNVAVLGQPGSGHVSHTPANLAPATRYFFRFHAVNSAGEHWAEQTNSTTTYPLVAAPFGGSASATSTGSAAANAFDGDPATVWRTAAGETAASLVYQFSNDTAARVTRYSVTSAPDSPAGDPRDWRLEGSLDGVAWTVLDTRAGVVFYARGQTLDFGFVNGASFRFHRLVVTANNGDASLLQLAELRLWSPSIVPDSAGPVITTPGNLVVAGATSAGANVFFDVSALDAVSGNCAAVANPASGALFPVGNTTVTVTAADAAGNTSSATFVVTVTAPVLPAPWTIRQINPYPGVAAGTATANTAASFTIVGAGGASTGGATGDLWTGSNDSNTFVSVPWQGDGTFTARLASFTSSDVSAKAGIIFRETTTAGSRYSAIYLIRNNGGAVLFQHKTATNGATTNTNFFNGSVTNRGIPEWIRLVRQGDVFTLSYSEDGSAWTQLSSRANAMAGSELAVGFVVAPRTGGSSATATFDNISFLSPLQSWRQANFGVVAGFGNAADAADPDGDGVPNLLEYALGRSPTAATASPPALLELVQIEGATAPRLTVTFNRIADPALTYAVEAADTPAGPWGVIWTSAGAANVAGEVIVPDVVDVVPDRPRRFLRLRVTTP